MEVISTFFCAQLWRVLHRELLLLPLGQLAALQVTLVAVERVVVALDDLPVHLESQRRLQKLRKDQKLSVLAARGRVGLLQLDFAVVVVVVVAAAVGVVVVVVVNVKDSSFAVVV